jgi:hypothetical protein
MKELAVAMAKAQAQVKTALKDSKNPAFKSSYADLASIWDACREALNKNGLSIIQRTDFSEQDIWLETMLLHVSGDSISSRYPLRPLKQDPQGYGSALTYAKRYTLASMVGVVADEDDDGNAASGRTNGHADNSRQPDRSQAARAFVTESIKAIGGLKTENALDDWYAENAPKLGRLKENYPEEAKMVQGALVEQRQALVKVAAE